VSNIYFRDLCNMGTNFTTSKNDESSKCLGGNFARYFNGDECFRKHSKLQITGSVYCFSSSNDILAPAVNEKQGKSDM